MRMHLKAARQLVDRLLRFDRLQSHFGLELSTELPKCPLAPFLIRHSNGFLY